jgi:hypothetical protein
VLEESLRPGAEQVAEATAAWDPRARGPSPCVFGGGSRPRDQKSDQATLSHVGRHSEHFRCIDSGRHSGEMSDLLVCESVVLRRAKSPNQQGECRASELSKPKGQTGTRGELPSSYSYPANTQKRTKKALVAGDTGERRTECSSWPSRLRDPPRERCHVQYPPSPRANISNFSRSTGVELDLEESATWWYLGGVQDGEVNGGS